MAKQSLSGDKARAALLRGVEQVVGPVKVTLGPRGRNVLIERPGQPLATRDGVTVAKEMASLPDRFENMGASYAREVADAAVVDAGDGTTTASVILEAIVRDGLKLVTAGAEPLQLADGIDAAAKACAETIRKMSIPATPELVRQAAIISTHGDVELGTMIAEATCKVGATGVLELQESRDEHTTIEHLEGFYFERGWRPHQFFARDSTGQKCVLRRPLILISERLIVGAHPKLDGDHLTQIALKVAAERRPLLIIAEDLQGDALNFFTANIAHGAIEGCFVKLPGFGDQRQAAVEDLRIAICAKRVHTQTSTRVDDQLTSFKLEDLGWCEQAVISPTRTVLIGGGANDMLKTKRVKQLIDESQASANPFEKEQLDHRIARLTGGVAVLRVGGASEPEMLEKKSRAEDAIHACRGALQEGVVPGAGMALARAAKEYSAIHGFNADTGEGVLLRAIMEPAKQIVRNAGCRIECGAKVADGAWDGEPIRGTGAFTTAEHIVDSFLDFDRPEHGLNSATGQTGNLMSMGIVDPTKVVLTALTKAASIGALLLTTEVLVCDTPVENPAAMMPPALRM